MALSEEQIKELKKQLSKQIEHLPEEQKKTAQTQIDNMSDDAIEEMLSQQKQTASQPVFRSIVSGEIPSKKIDENKDAIAVLDIKPISKGHIVIIPKNKVEEIKKLPKSISTLSKKISKKIVSKLKAKSTEIQPQEVFGEVILNIIPIYDTPLTINSPRQEVKEEELQELYILLKEEKKLPVIKMDKKPKKGKPIKLERRIP